MSDGIEIFPDIHLQIIGSLACPSGRLDQGLMLAFAPAAGITVIKLRPVQHGSGNVDQGMVGHPLFKSSRTDASFLGIADPEKTVGSEAQARIGQFPAQCKQIPRKVILKDTDIPAVSFALRRPMKGQAEIVRIQDQLLQVAVSSHTGVSFSEALKCSEQTLRSSGPYLSTLAWPTPDMLSRPSSVVIRFSTISAS